MQVSAGTEDGELDARLVEQGGDGLGRAFGPVFQRARAADPEQVLDVRVELALGDGDLEVELADPLGAAGLAHAPRVALVLQVLQHARGLDRERRLDQHLVAAHPVDVVDVLDVHRALLDARAAVRTRPDHVGVDDAVFILSGDQGAFGLVLDGVWQLVAVLVGGGQQVRGLGEGVVAQVQDDLLGRQRLAGGPGRALRLAPPALGAGGHVQQALPGEVLDLAQAEHVGVRVGLFEVEHLPVAAHRLEGAEGVRAAGEQDVQRGQRDVQVLGVHHDDREGHDDGDLSQQEHRLQDAVHAGAQRSQPVADDLAGERAVGVGEVAGVDLGAAVEQQGGDDQEDHAQDQPRGPGVRAEEAGLAAFLVRVVPQPDDGEGNDAGQHADGEQVLDEPDERPVANAGDRERLAEQVAVDLDDREQQTMKPQNVAACAAPGTDHLNSLR